MATASITINNKIKFTFRYTFNGSYSATHASVHVYLSSVTAGNILSHPYSVSLQTKVSTGGSYATFATGSVTKKGVFTTSGGSADATIPKSHSASTATLYFRVVMSATDSSGSSHDKSTRVSLSIPVKTSYKVTYNANGGSGAPGQDIKWYNETLTLSKTKPTKTGHDFVGWGATPTTSASNVVTTYSGNSATTFYAIYTPKKYTISYNGNGAASGSMTSHTRTYGQSGFALKANAFVGKTNMGFQKWNTKSDGTGTNYGNPSNNGAVAYNANASATMYAIWGQIYASPKLTIKSAYRCDSGGSPDDEGTYLGVEAVYTLYNTGNNSVSSWTLSCNGQSTTTPASGGTGLSGNVKMVLAAGLSATSRYTATLTLKDTAGGSGNKSTNTVTKSVSIGTTAYPINVLAGGNGVAIGGTARRSGWLDVGNGFSAAFESNGRFDTMDAGHSFASPSSAADSQGNPANEYGNSWLCYDSVGNLISYAQTVNTTEAVYRSLAVTNPRSGSGGTLSLYLQSYDNGTTKASLNGSATWDASDIPNGMPAAKITSDSTSTVNNVITAASGWTISSVTAKRWGKLCSLTVQAKKNAAIDYPVTGDIPNQVIGTLKTGYLPSDYAPGMCSTYPGWAILYTNGEVRWLTAQPRSSADTIAAETNLLFCFHYMLA